MENCKASNIVDKFFNRSYWKYPSKHVLKTSSTRLQRNNFTSSKTTWKRTSWRRLRRRKIVTLKTSWRRLEDISWRLLEDMSWRRLEDMSWRPFKDFMETNKILTGDICILISGFNKPKCVSNKSVFHKSISDNSKANPKCINYWWLVWCYEISLIQIRHCRKGEAIKTNF